MFFCCKCGSVASRFDCNVNFTASQPSCHGTLSPTDENPHVTFRHVSLHSTPESQLLVSRHIFSGCVAVSCGSTAASSRQLPNEGAVYSGHSRSKPEHNRHPRQKCTTRNGTVSQTLLGKSALYGPLLLWLGHLLEGTKLVPCLKVAL